MNQAERKLVEVARDAEGAYKATYAMYLQGAATLDQVMVLRRASEKAQVKMRQAVKKGSYAQIEKDLKAKYSR